MGISIFSIGIFNRRSFSAEAFRHFCQMFILIFALMLAGFAQAANLLQPFPLAEKEMEETLVLDQHMLATGRIQNKGGEAFPESWLSLPAGTLNQALYRVRSTRDTDEILEYYQNHLMQPGSDVLFQCSGRECGSSNDWANRVFKMSTLYGVDREQHYFAVRHKLNDASDNYISVYITERGTGRIYVYVSHYRVNAEKVVSKGSVHTLFEQLQDDGWVELPVMPDGQFEEDAREPLKQLVSKIQASSDRYWLVAHHYGRQSDQALMLKSEQAAARLLSALEVLGLSPDKLEFRGLGALAPTKGSVAYGGRLELVVMK
ncbi:DUF4892 domain-containing protein [Oceanospirillum linum]|uniref:DUF4892 domain-containing protein n=1 Tax=Oceanospirillum linum TaxID=966 RepID=A0A1T1HER3_OCELI|nr:DUF4892 domain-containing protein [Oceanospirillum linum]OOV88316.1 hypothetical protein BTA35_0202000 [Oceanospirillum linum]SEF51941.1 protein of unknown function [Oleiphilus messinensis]SMP04193.1 protein of unknown function [Oceanospirillum linum]